MVKSRLSFCVTNYNCAHTLEKHLDSIYDIFSSYDFEYIVVDNRSSDTSYEILIDYASQHTNMKVLSRRSTRGWARQLAFQESSGDLIVLVDTDTVYYPYAADFMRMYLDGYGKYAVQAKYLGVFPRTIWEEVGGMSNFNTAEDFELWMRIWKTGKMKWYPVRMGENVKEAGATDAYDFLSSRYGRFEKFTRFLRSEIDSLRLRKYVKMDLTGIWKSNVVDFELGKMEETYFGERLPPPFSKLPKHFVKSVLDILTG